jgi:hypothetical protein
LFHVICRRPVGDRRRPALKRFQYGRLDAAVRKHVEKALVRSSLELDSVDKQSITRDERAQDHRNRPRQVDTRGEYPSGEHDRRHDGKAKLSLRPKTVDRRVERFVPSQEPCRRDRVELAGHRRSDPRLLLRLEVHRLGSPRPAEMRARQATPFQPKRVNLRVATGGLRRFGHMALVEKLPHIHARHGQGAFELDPTIPSELV